MKNDCSLQNEVSMQGYQSVLLKIANTFGFNNQQSQCFLHEVYRDVNNSYPQYQVKELSMRLYLSKLMVNKCIFKISEHFFSQNNNGAFSTLCTGINSVFISSSQLKLQHIPLSYRSVYLIKNIMEFSETEIAELLNIALIQVKERFNKANSLMGNMDTIVQNKITITKKQI